MGKGKPTAASALFLAAAWLVTGCSSCSDADYQKARDASYRVANWEYYWAGLREAGLDLEDPRVVRAQTYIDLSKADLDEIFADIERGC